MNDKPHWSEPLPIQMIRSRFSSLRGNQLDHLAVMVVSGSFNPVHTQHIRAMEAARIGLERAGWAIAGGFLAPSSDSYLQGKLNSHGLSFSRRTELCCLATQDSNWLAVCSLGEFSSYRACTRIREQVERQCAGLLEGRTLTGLEVMGSDTAIRIMDKLVEEWATTDVGGRQPWYHSRIVCCIVRPGPESSADTDRVLKFTAARAAEIGISVILVDGALEAFPLEVVSSTDVRELLQKRDWEGLRARRWLHPEVLRSLETSTGV